MINSVALQRNLRATLLFLFWSLVFGTAYCQAPLYYSNQNQYFLHGLAAAGRGNLPEDWLANTLDPTPVFSLGVTATSRFLHDYAFYFYHIIVAGIYFTSMFGLFSYLAGDRKNRGTVLGFIALFLGTHSALARLCSCRWLDLDYPWYFQAGVAGQYVLGAMFQPSMFGVLLILSIYCFVKGRPFRAVAWACLAATLHSTYLLSAGILTMVYMSVLTTRGRTRQGMLLGGWGIILVFPIMTYNLISFSPNSTATFAEARHILVNMRLPHHSLPERWCDGIALVQVAWFLVALYLVRATRLFPILGVTFLLSLGLTLFQGATGNETLALLFPWRTSVFLVPVATMIILTRLAIALRSFLARPVARACCIAVIAGLVGAGFWIGLNRLAFQTPNEELAMMEFVKTHKTPGDRYLLPVHVPNLAMTPRGSLSSDFKSLIDKKQDSRLIPVDLQRFRLYTEAPIFVDFKSIPYKDTEVLDWHTRLGVNQKFYDHIQAGTFAQVRDELQHRHITHVVMTADHEVDSACLEKVYEDNFYRVYRINFAATQTGTGGNRENRRKSG